MSEGKEQKKLKTKKSQNKDNSGMNRTTRRKAPKNIAQLEEILKTSIIKQFTLLNKDTVNPTQLKTILLSIGFATQDVRQAIAKSATNSNAEFSGFDVFKLAIQLPHRDLWKKECFQIFSNKKQKIEVQDLESAVKSVEGSRKSTLNWEKIMKYQGFEFPALSQADFAKLLAVSNTFCE